MQNQTTLETLQAPQPDRKKKPLWETRVGAFSVSIWENRRNINGRSVPVRNISLTKRFRGKDGELKSSTSYLMENEVPKAIVALHAALTKLSYNDFQSATEEAD